MQNKLFFLLSAITFFLTSCEKEKLNEEIIRGQWFVEDIRGDYRINRGDAATEQFINQFFYGDHLNFLMGEDLNFFDDNQLVVRQLNDELLRYDYEWNDKILTVSKGRFDPVFYFADGYADRMTIRYDRNSLIDYLNERIYNTANDANQAYWQNLIRKVENQVSEFYIDYRMSRRSPSIQKIISGNFYGSLVDNTGKYNEASVSLIENRDHIDFYLNNQIILNGGTAISITIPNITFSNNMQGNFEFAGAINMAVPGYGFIYATVKGNSEAGNIVDMLLTLTGNNINDTFEFRDGYRNVLIPYSPRAKTLKTIEPSPKE